MSRSSQWRRSGRARAAIGKSRAAGGLAHLALGALVLAACQAGIMPDRERAPATVRAYETEVARLEATIGDQQATLAALTPPPPPATPLPLSARWRVDLAGSVVRRDRVGVRDGLTPLAARGDFLVVPVTVTNLTDDPALFNPAASVRVEDGEGRTFELDPRATGAAYLIDFGYDPSFAPRQPGVPYLDVLVFDVAEDATEFTLTAADGSWATPIRVATTGTPVS